MNGSLRTDLSNRERTYDTVAQGRRSKWGYFLHRVFRHFERKTLVTSLGREKAELREGNKMGSPPREEGGGPLPSGMTMSVRIR